MGLSKMEKEALEAHFKGTDLYDPSKAPEQATASEHFAPQCEHGEMEGMCKGGCAGYAEGGEVGNGGPVGMEEWGQEISDAIRGSVAPATQAIGSMVSSAVSPLSAIADLSKGLVEGKTTPTLGHPASMYEPRALRDAPSQQTIKTQPIGPSLAPDAPLGVNRAPAASAPRMAPSASSEAVPKANRFSELDSLLRPTAGKAVLGGLAGLADAIMSGVARTNSPGFLKHQTDRRQQLIDALKAKYEAGDRAQEVGLGKSRLGEEVRSHKVDESQREKALSEDVRFHDLQAGQHTAELGNAAAKARVEAAKAVIDAYEKGHFLSTARPSGAEYQNAKNILTGAAAGGTVRFRDSTGQLHDIPAENLQKAKARDPGLQVVQ